MEKYSSVDGTVPVANGAPARIPTVVVVAPITVLPIITINAPATSTASAILLLLVYTKPFSDISKIEVFSSQIFKR